MKSIPIILLVSERSGSNLLRTLIGKHKEICAPVAPHLMAEFYKIRKYYGDLRNKKNSKDLLSDMLVVTNHPYHDWGLELGVESCNSSGTSIVSAFDLVYSEKAKQEGKIHYCSKGVHSFSYIDPFRAELDNVKFIHLIRDPRDHVASWMKRPINLLTAYDAIRKWKSEQKVIIDAVSSKGLDCLTIKYEDLISDTKNIMTRILDYLELEVDENCFTTNESNIESKRNPYWQNLSKPVMKNNKGKFMKELSDEDILIIETIANKEMEFFGYSKVTTADWIPNPDFMTELERKRKTKRKEILINSKERMEELENKWHVFKKLKSERKDKWEKSNNSYFYNIPQIKTSLKSRLRHLSLGLLGEKSTEILLSKIK